MSTNALQMISQPENIGERRVLDAEQADKIAYLLRAIEQLPSMSKDFVNLSSGTPSAEELKRWATFIHKNHEDMARLATSLMFNA